jgi:hypothetical protein
MTKASSNQATTIAIWGERTATPWSEWLNLSTHFYEQLGLTMTHLATDMGSGNTVRSTPSRILDIVDNMNGAEVSAFHTFVLPDEFRLEHTDYLAMSSLDVGPNSSTACISVVADSGNLLLSHCLDWQHALERFVTPKVGELFTNPATYSGPFHVLMCDNGTTNEAVNVLAHLY